MTIPSALLDRIERTLLLAVFSVFVMRMVASWLPSR